MAQDDRLAQRVRKALADQPGFAEKKMFGGLCFLVNGNMVCGVNKDGLMVRVGPEQYEEALAQPHAGVMDFTGRTMKGFVRVDPAGSRTQKAVEHWVARALNFVLTLPAK